LPDAAEWAALLSYAKAISGRTRQIFGIMTEGHGTSSPEEAYI
jgi:hypothetical protein